MIIHAHLGHRVWDMLASESGQGSESRQWIEVLFWIPLALVGWGCTAPPASSKFAPKEGPSITDKELISAVENADKVLDLIDAERLAHRLGRFGDECGYWTLVATRVKILAARLGGNSDAEVKAARQAHLRLAEALRSAERRERIEHFPSVESELVRYWSARVAVDLARAQHDQGTEIESMRECATNAERLCRTLERLARRQVAWGDQVATMHARTSDRWGEVEVQLFRLVGNADVTREGLTKAGAAMDRAIEIIETRRPMDVTSAASVLALALRARAKARLAHLNGLEQAELAALQEIVRQGKKRLEAIRVVQERIATSRTIGPLMIERVLTARIIRDAELSIAQLRSDDELRAMARDGYRRALEQTVAETERLVNPPGGGWGLIPPYHLMRLKCLLALDALEPPAE